MRKIIGILAASFILLFALSGEEYAMAADKLIGNATGFADGDRVTVAGQLLKKESVNVTLMIFPNGMPETADGKEVVFEQASYFDQCQSSPDGGFEFNIKKENLRNGSDARALLGCSSTNDSKYIKIYDITDSKVVSAAQLGADNTGITDSTLIMTKLHDTGKKIFYSDGTYLFNGENLDLSGGVEFESANVKIRNSISDVNIINFDCNGNLIGLMQNHLEEKYSADKKITSGSLVSPPVSTADYDVKVDFVPFWYNDFGLEYRRSVQGGGKTWYDWSWNFHSRVSDDITVAYDPERHPLLGFYRGDDPIVLDWQCYWLREFGAKGVILYSSNKTESPDSSWENEANAYHWMYELMNNTANFKGMGYALTFNATYPQADADSATLQNMQSTLKNVWYATIDNIYKKYNHPYCIEENGKRYPAIYVHEENAVVGTFDGYYGDNVSETVSFYESLADRFIAMGYDGAAILVRNNTTKDNYLKAALDNSNKVIRLDVEYAPKNVNTNGETATYEELIDSYSIENDRCMVPNAFTARLTHDPHPTTWNTPGHTPALFNKLLNKLTDNIYEHDRYKLMTCYNVAEWAEGGPGLQPNVKNGFGYLQAVKDAVVVNGNSKEKLNVSYIADDGSLICDGEKLPKNSNVTVSCTVMSEQTVSGKIIVALYSGGMLKDIKMNDITAEPYNSYMEITLSASELSGADEVKTMLIDKDIKDIRPLAASYVKEH